jgi:hypothetical protein
LLAEDCIIKHHEEVDFVIENKTLEKTAIPRNKKTEVSAMYAISSKTKAAARFACARIVECEEKFCQTPAQYNIIPQVGYSVSNIF